MIKSLNDAYESKFTYWCNALGEINLPWRKDDYNGKVSELPPKIAALYRERGVIDCGVKNYVITDDDKLGLGYCWLVDYLWLSDLGLSEDEDVSAELESAAQAIQEMFPYADVYIGTNTDLDGHEIVLFIPSDKLVTFRTDTAHKEMGLGGEIYDLIRDEFKKKKREQDEVVPQTAISRYLAFIRAEFVRDAQFYNGESLSDDIDIHDEEHEDNWSDINGSVLIFDGKAKSEKEVIGLLKLLYSCSENEFLVIKVEDDSCIGNPEKAVTRYHYETGKVETEVMGSGSSFSFVRTTDDEAEAFRLYLDPSRNYLIRWRMEDGLKITDTWDRNSQSWLPASITREKGVQKSITPPDLKNRTGLG